VLKNSPPSENESGVTFRTPMIIGFAETSILCWRIFQSVAPIEIETITVRLLL
jgi:hypothetical protein